MVSARSDRFTCSPRLSGHIHVISSLRLNHAYDSEEIDQCWPWGEELGTGGAEDGFL